ncbi:MAG: IS66 family insertion sequence element accessory protein TnpB [Lachnospiraceae bacterium]|nr:IS66 family insertion sequence element accessory protein TnpB [Lachnospiraceae bacterium]
MTKRNPRRTDEEWLNLIQECRLSGLSDKYWCEQHHIHPSNFYYHIKRLRNKACDIPEAISSPLSQKQEVVPLSFGKPTFLSQAEQSSSLETSETAIRITVHGFQVEITNVAASETIFNTLSVLQRLC